MKIQIHHLKKSMQEFIKKAKLFFLDDVKNKKINNLDICLRI